MGTASHLANTLAKPRRPWLAALLSLLGAPLGQVYAGRFRRSIVLWIVFVVLLPVFAFSATTLLFGRLGLTLLFLHLLGFPIYVVVDAFLCARHCRDAPLKRYQRWWIYVLLFLAFFVANNVVTYTVRTFIAEAFVVPTRSMSPTIQPGDRVLVDKLWSNARRLRSNDVVVFRSDGPNTPMYVMRVAGLPGDEIEIRNERVLVNGEPWDDHHGVFNGPMPLHGDIANYGPSIIPDDCFFVLGDNRRLSLDSRLLGPIPLSDFCGTARLIYWSQTRTFPDPRDTSHYTLGPIRWDRIGSRLD